MTSSNIQPGTVEPPIGIERLTNTKWEKPEYKLPLPSLQFLFHLECDMESFHHIGKGPHGDRSTVIFKGGRFEGPKLRGEILPGGGGEQCSFLRQSIHSSNQSLLDWETVQDHDGDQQTAHLDTRYNLKTHDGAMLYLRTTG